MPPPKPLSILAILTAVALIFWALYRRREEDIEPFEKDPDEIDSGPPATKHAVICKKIKENQYTKAFDLHNVIGAKVCDEFVRLAEKYASENGGWTTKRHEAYATTDLDTADIPLYLCI